jgi:hypothetical protein
MIIYVGNMHRPNVYRQLMNINYNYILDKYVPNIKIVSYDDILNSTNCYSEKDIFILTWRDLKKLETKINKNSIILINIEPLPHMKEALDILIKYSSSIKAVIDYSYKNIDYIQSYLKHIQKVFFIPMCYTKELEDKIFYKQRKYVIDIHMYGELNMRRKIFIENMKKIRPEINILARQKYGSIIEQNRRSCMVKISPVIFTNPDFKHFDHYRCAYLLTKKCLVIHEQIDIETEDDKELCNNLIFCSYDEMPNKINEILNLSDEDIYNLALKQYTYYKSKWNMETYFMNSGFLKHIDEITSTS